MPKMWTSDPATQSGRSKPSESRIDTDYGMTRMGSCGRKRCAGNPLVPKPELGNEKKVRITAPTICEIHESLPIRDSDNFWVYVFN